MKEFMLLIRNTIDYQINWPSERHMDFLKRCESYILELKKEGNLISAQPLEREGKIISGKKGSWNEFSLNNNELQVGYYHILAASTEEAVSIAKENPEFEYSTTAAIEVRPVKVKEEKTSFTYQKGF